MAMGEQFGSRTITHTPLGARGRRIFKELWQDRYKPNLPYVGQRWPADVHNIRDPGMQEPLWCHDIVIKPYGKSGTKATANNVAANVEIEYQYEPAKPLGSEVESWIVSTNATLQTYAGDPNAHFLTHPEHLLSTGTPHYASVTEIVVRGLEYLGVILAPFQPRTRGSQQRSSGTYAAWNSIGYVCSELWWGTQPPGQLLFLSESTGEPFMRRGIGLEQPGWYREFSRKFLLKSIWHPTSPDGLRVAGHNQEWDAEEKIWDTVSGGLYEERTFGATAGADQVFPF